MAVPLERIAADLEATLSDPDYLQLKRELASPLVVFDDAAWRALLKHKRALDAHVAAMKAATRDTDDVYDTLARALRNEYALLTAGVRRLQALDVDMDEINRRIDALGALEREVDAALRGAPAREDLARMAAQLETIAARPLTATAMRTARDVARKLRGRLAPAPAPALVVSAAPMSEERAGQLAAAVGAWLRADARNLLEARTPAAAPAADMLRVVAAFAPQVFNLMRALWDEALPTDAWIAAAGEALRPSDVAVVLAYVVPRRLFGPNALSARQRVNIEAFLKHALEITPAPDARMNLVRLLLCRLALPAVLAEYRARPPTPRWGGKTFWPSYARAMMRAWSPTADGAVPASALADVRPATADDVRRAFANI